MLTFYDIDSKSKETWSPNTFKTKLALAHKGLLAEARTERISYPSIAPFLQSKGVEKCPGPAQVNWTLPAIEDDGKTIMDSWKIAEYLETQYPDTPTLFPGDSKPLARLLYPFFMTQISIPIFPLLLPKVVDFLDDRGAEYFKRTREESFGEPISHEIYKDTERVEKMWKSVERNLKLMETTLTDVEGPYLLGEERSYADLLIASLMGWYKVCSPDMYDRMVSVAPALGRLHDKCMELLHIEMKAYK